MLHKILLLCSVSVIFTVFTALRADNAEQDLAARQLWLDGFLKMSKAAQLAEQGKISTAIHAYQDAMDHFNEVHEKFPQWNTTMVTFRISSCRLKIQELDDAISPNVENLSMEELKNRLKEEISRNISLAIELDEAHRNKKTEDNNAMLLQEKDARINELKQRINELEVKLKLEQVKISRMKTDEDFNDFRKELADLVMVKQEDVRKINELTSNLEEAKGQNDSLKKQIDSLKKQLAEADKWAETKQSANDIISAENEQLKKMVADLKKNLQFFEEKAALNIRTRDEIEKLEKMAFELEDKDDAATAARYWHTISNKYPDAQEPALRAAYWYWLVEDSDNSNTLLDRYFVATSRNVEPMILLGRVSLDQNNWPRALTLASWAATAAPDNADAQFTLGAVFLSNAQAALAKACFRKAVEIDPKHTDSLMALAIIYATVEPRNLTEAKKFYDRAVAAGHPLDPAFEAVVK